jgi:hypothetical protein
MERLGVRERRLVGTNMVGHDESAWDWGRNGLTAVATRHLGWRLIEVVREIFRA